MESLDPSNQLHWRGIIEESRYTITAIVEAHELKERTVSGWLQKKDPIRPTKKNFAKFEGIMKKISKEPKIPFHPSYGYATPEQIEKLNSLPLGADRNYLLRQIEKQNEKKGKY